MILWSNAVDPTISPITVSGADGEKSILSPIGQGSRCVPANFFGSITTFLEGEIFGNFDSAVADSSVSIFATVVIGSNTFVITGATVNNLPGSNNPFRIQFSIANLIPGSSGVFAVYSETETVGTIPNPITPNGTGGPTVYNGDCTEPGNLDLTMSIVADDEGQLFTIFSVVLKYHKLPS